MTKRIALITGAGAGIGAAISENLAASGHHVILADLNAEAACRLTGATGPIETPLSREVHTEAVREAYNAHVPAHHYGQPEEVAAIAGFLASDAAAYINGHVVPVDGGFLAAGMLAN